MANQNNNRRQQGDQQQGGQGSQGKQPTALQRFSGQLEDKVGTFGAVLPAHISPTLFRSVVMTAVSKTPSLLEADRVSLFEACVNAANDGLLPNGIQGALVVYNTKVKGQDGEKDYWIKKVQWLPMVRGLMDKTYQTGKVRSISVDMVWPGDAFKYWKDEQGEHLQHQPLVPRGRDETGGNWIAVYAMVVMNDGALFAEVLDQNDVWKIAAASKQKDDSGNPSGVWKSWPEEMAKKSAFKRLGKRLPISRDITVTLDRDNYLYSDEHQALPSREPRKSLASSFEELANGGSTRQVTHSPGQQVQTGGSREREFAPLDDEDTSQQGGKKQETQKSQPKEDGGDGGKGSGRSTANNDPGPEPTDEELEEAHADGLAAGEKRQSARAMKSKFKAHPALEAAWLKGHSGEVDE